MTDEQVVSPNNKVTVGFEHTVIRGEYGDGKSVASIYVQADVAPDADDEEWVGTVRDAFARAKSAVFKELDIKFNLEEGYVRAVLQEFPGAVRENVQAAPAAPVTTQAVSATPPYSKAEINNADDDQAKAYRRENSAWARQRYDAGFQREFFDNRAKKANGEYGQNSPDFTHKDSRAGFWLD